MPAFGTGDAGRDGRRGDGRASTDVELAITTDSYVVKPLRFPGGSIGELAVNGTVNDLAVSGARPLALSLSLILEEGLARRRAARRGRRDRARRARGRRRDRHRRHEGRRARPRRRDVRLHDRDRPSRPARDVCRRRRSAPGDRILLSGSVGEHGTAIMLARGEFELDAEIESDTRSLWPAVDALLDAAGPELRCMRDATRGGVASVLNELARASSVAMIVREARGPGATRRSPARPRSSGSTRCTSRTRASWSRSWRRRRPSAALAALRAVPGCEQAAEIGEVRTEPPGMVLVQTSFGGRRVMDQLVGRPAAADLLRARGDGMATMANPYAKQKETEAVTAHVLWMTTGLSCEGDSVAMTSATNPSLEDIILQAIPGMPKVVVHNQVVDYAVGQEYAQAWFDAEQGKLDPFVLVIEGSLGNEEINGDGHWTGVRGEPGERPADHDERVARPARAEGRGGRRGRARARPTAASRR